VSSPQIHIESISQFPPLSFAHEESNRHAVHTIPWHEKFEEKPVCTFLPVLGEIHLRSGRRSKVEVPMFSCHVGQAGHETQVVSVEQTRRSISLRAKIVNSSWPNLTARSSDVLIRVYHARNTGKYLLPYCISPISILNPLNIIVPLGSWSRAKNAHRDGKNDHPKWD
jgi:hypothetical protein